MKDVFLLYDSCCFYEIVILNYFMSCTECDVVFCSLDGKPIRATEGYCVNVDMPLSEIDKSQIRSFIIPGGDISVISNDTVFELLQELKEKNVVVGGICAAVDLLEKSGILNGLQTTHSADSDVANDKKVITARANAYVDFAIEVAKELELFEDEADLQETIDFWKYHKRMD